MAKPTWRVGAFAERYPGPARDVGRAHKLELVANRMLYASAGVVDPNRLANAAYGDPTCAPCAPGEMARGCCNGPPCAPGMDTCCARGTCLCGAEADGFEDIYPDAGKQLANAHAFGAALRDLLTDPDEGDVAGAISTATALFESGKLAALYAPQVPAKKMPDGSDAPARCPVCGCTVCPTCGDPCACVPGAMKKPAAPAAAM
jgi:hypothetical protein